VLVPLFVAIAELAAAPSSSTTLPSLPPDPSAPAAVAVEDPPIFPLKDIKAGQRARGWTVFESGKGPEPFEAVVLGVMKGYLGPGEDLIIARLEGKQIERTGVIAGMSGSPVYIDGKLVGAVGYRFGSFTKDAIAGITPIERMLTAASPAADGSPASPRRASSSSSPSSSGGAKAGPMTAWGRGEPIAVPVSVSGLSPQVLEAFQPLLAERGYGPVVAAGGASGGTSTSKPVRFYAGGPIAGDIIEGDINMGAIGTVTWVKGNRFLAFGHPFMGNGATAMPVANAEIITTVASDAGSWKMGQPTTPVGRLSDDRLHAIAGTMGETPPMVPLTVRLDTASPRAAGDAKKELLYNVFQHETDTPLFMAIAVANTLSNRVGAEKAGGTVDVQLTAKLSTGDVIPYSFRAADEGVGFELPVAFGVMGLLSAAMEQDWVDVKLASVDVSVKSRREVDRARIVSVDATRPLVSGQPGEIRVRLQSFRGPVVEKRVPVRVPAGLPTGTYQLVVAGQQEAGRVEKEGGLVPVATTFPAFLKNLQNQPPPGSLSVYLVDDNPSMRLDGRPLPDLPGSLSGLLGDGGGWSGGMVEGRAMKLSRVIDPGVIAGETSAKVRVRGAHEDEE
jgi:hypothetical protein